MVSDAKFFLAGFYDAHQVKQEIAVLEQMFRTLVKKTQKDLKEVDMDDLQLDILHSSTPIQVLHSDLYGKLDKRKLISETKSPKEILVMLSDHWNFLDYDILKYIIDLYGCAETKQLLDEFLIKQKSFLRCTKVELFIKVWPFQADPVPESQSSSIQVKLSKGTETLEQVDQTRRSFYAACPLSQHMLQLSEIQIGCILVTWLIPSEIVHKLQVSLLLSLLPPRSQSPTTSKTVKLFRNFNISCISIVGVRIFDEDPVTREEKHMISRPLALTSEEVENATAALGMEDPADLTFHLRNLKEALRDFENDKQLKVLGFYLGLTLQDLTLIQNKAHNLGQEKDLLLKQWLEDVTACWKKLVVSLKKIPAALLAEQIVSKYPNLKYLETQEQSHFGQLSHQTWSHLVNVSEVSKMRFEQKRFSEREIEEKSGILLSKLGEMIEKSRARLRATTDELRQEAQRGEDYWKQEIKSQKHLVERLDQQSSQLTSDLPERLQKAEKMVKHFIQLKKLESDLESQERNLKIHQQNMQAKTDYNSELTVRIARLEKLKSCNAVCLRRLQTEYNNFKKKLNDYQLATKENMAICFNARRMCEDTMKMVKSQLKRLRQHLNDTKPSLRTFVEEKQNELLKWELILGSIIAAGTTAAVVGVVAAPFTLGLSLIATGIGGATAVTALVYMVDYSRQSRTTIEQCRVTADKYESSSDRIDGVLTSLEVHC